MKDTLRSILSDTRDVIALLIVITWCLSIFLPETAVSNETQKSFETIMLLVLGYFFGRAGSGQRKPPESPNPTRPMSTDCFDMECKKRKP